MVPFTLWMHVESSSMRCSNVRSYRTFSLFPGDCLALSCADRAECEPDHSPAPSFYCGDAPMVLPLFYRRVSFS